MYNKHILYQLLPRTFSNYCDNRKHNGTIEENGCGKFNCITSKALRSIHQLGATHIWYTGIIRHATQTDYSDYGIPKCSASIVKGKAGSPYAITDYYDVDPDLAEDIPNRMHEFEALVKRTHNANLKVVIDFVANHVAREYRSVMKPDGVVDLGASDNPDWAFSPLNNFYYLPNERFSPLFDGCDYEEYPAKVTGNDCFTSSPSRNDWYDTVKLNYGVYYQGGMEKQFSPIPDTWHKMLEILLYWVGKGVDGFRCDMAEMVPVEFWHWAIPQVKAGNPDVLFIAEVYNPHLYRSYIYDGGFDLLYDKVGMYDYLRGVTSRDFSAEGITLQWQANDDIHEHLLYFLENHDEQRIASGFFCGRGICAEPAVIVMSLLNTNPVMIYAGQELGELGMDSEGFSGVDGRTTIFDYWGVRSLQRWSNNGKYDGGLLSDEQKELRSFYRQLLHIARTEKTITEGKKFDLVYAQREGFNKNKQYAFIRGYKNELLLVVVNFDAHQTNVSITIPEEAFTYFGMKPQNAPIDCVDLLSGRKLEVALSADTPIDVEISAWKGLVLKMIL